MITRARARITCLFASSCVFRCCCIVVVVVSPPFLPLVCISLIRFPESTAFACFSLQLVEFVLPVVLVPVNLQERLSGEEREQFHAYYMSCNYKLRGIR